jgi:hypothetical protein
MATRTAVESAEPEPSGPIALPDAECETVPKAENDETAKGASSNANIQTESSPTAGCSAEIPEATGDDNGQGPGIASPIRQ